MASKHSQGVLVDAERLRIRRFRREDFSPFAEFMTDDQSTHFLEFGGAEQRTEKGANALLQATIDAYDSAQPLLAFAVEELTSGDFVGFCGLHPQDQETVEIMYAVVPSARRKGYATEIATTLGHYAMDKLGYSRITAPIDLENKYSRLAAISAGFKDHGPAERENPPRIVREFILEKEQRTRRATKSPAPEVPPISPLDVGKIK